MAPSPRSLHRYNVHMRDARGLGVGTRKGRLAIVGRLLQCKFAGPAPIAIGELQPKDVRGFIATELTRVNSVSRAQRADCCTASLLPLSRHLRRCLACLLGVISSPARWSLASLPRALTDEQVGQVLLADYAEARSTPLRLLAMVHLALDLGLRVGEIARLEINGFDWRAGTVTLKGTKSLRQDVLPLPAATGEALAAYVMHERPATALPTLFECGGWHHTTGPSA